MVSHNEERNLLSRFSAYLFKQNRWVSQHVLWILGVCVLWGLDLATKFDDRAKFGAGPDDFRLVAEQITSALAVLIMIYFVACWHRFALQYRYPTILFCLVHICGYVVFSVGHYALLERMRAWSYEWFGHVFVNNAYLANLLGEMQKDLKIYIGIVVIISLYRHYGFKQRARTVAKDRIKRRRILVMTGRGEKILNIDDICFLQAAKNYVAFHTKSQEYLVRDTFDKCMQRLDTDQFFRVHRSYTVNLNHVGEIVGHGRNKQGIRFENGSMVPISRTYQSAFQNRIKEQIHSGSDTHPSE